MVLEIEPRTSCIHGKCSDTSTMSPAPHCVWMLFSEIDKTPWVKDRESFRSVVFKLW